MAARLKEFHNNELRAQLQEELSQPNPMAVPRLVKVVVNMGVGRATQDIKELDKAVDELAMVTGQNPAFAVPASRWPPSGSARECPLAQR